MRFARSTMDAHRAGQTGRSHQTGQADQPGRANLAADQAGSADPYALSDEAVDRIRTAAREADFAIVAASNGLDMAEGLNIFRPEEHFYQNYGDFAQAYGVSSVLQGLFAQWPTEEAHWAFIARFAQREWLDYEPSSAMRRALALVAGKTTLHASTSSATDGAGPAAEATSPAADAAGPAGEATPPIPHIARPHFVVTCNMDGRFVRAGVDSGRVLETEGSIRYLRCSHGCSDELYPAEQIYRRLSAATVDCAVPSEFIPHCPHCGEPLVPAIDEARAYRPDAAYHASRRAFNDFLAQAHGHKLLVLELGIGARNRAIKQPLMRLVAREPQATYVTFNYSEVSIPREIAAKSVGVSGDLGAALARIVPDV